MGGITALIWVRIETSGVLMLKGSLVAAEPATSRAVLNSIELVS
jgi:hypothetical protein